MTAELIEPSKPMTLAEAFWVLRELESLGDVYSNFDHQLDEELAKELETSTGYGRHAAWEFFGHIWRDQKTGIWYELLMRHGAPVALYHGSSLREVLDKALEEWGTR